MPLKDCFFHFGSTRFALDELVHVGSERQRGDVEVEPGLDRAHLLARRAVGLREADVVAGRRLLEQRDELSVRLAGGRVGDEAELGVRASLGSGGADPCRGGERRGDEPECSDECDDVAAHVVSLG